MPVPVLRNSSFGTKHDIHALNLGQDTTISEPNLFLGSRESHTMPIEPLPSLRPFRGRGTQRRNFAISTGCCEGRPGWIPACAGMTEA